MDDIGTLEEAERAYQIICTESVPFGVPSVPNGWRLLKKGNCRTGLLGSDGVVYKVPHLIEGWRDRTFRNSRREAANLELWSGESFVPLWRLIEVPRARNETVPIVVMEFVENQGPPVMQFNANGVGLIDPRITDQQRGELASNYSVMKAALVAVEAFDYSGCWHLRDGLAIVIDAGGVERPDK